MSVLPMRSPETKDMSVAERRSVKESLDFQLNLFQLQEQLPAYYRCKIVLETVWAAVLLCLLAAPMFIISVLTYFKMGRPIFFKQLRVGLNARPFYVYKFRTMHNRAPAVIEMGLKPFEKISDDSRVTGELGRFLRRYKWDELPQLFSVLRGDMLLIGPRPYKYDENYEIKLSQFERYAIRPGISGLWQIEKNCAVTAAQKLELDHQYVSKMSFKLDLSICLRTLKVVIHGED